MKNILVLIVAATFIFSVSSFCLADNPSWRGTITKISGDKVTVKDKEGKLRIVDKSFGCSGCSGMDLKVGDKISVENGKIIKGLGKTELSPNFNLQLDPGKGGASSAR
jgi:hypothetical protein